MGIADIRDDSMKRIFLSSTFKDLAEYRKAAIEAIESLDGYHCIRMENFGARDWDADGFCRDQVAKADVFVGIVGHLYGSRPEGAEHSYTEREYEMAVEAKKPILMFLAPESFAVPNNLIEPDELRTMQRAFRQRVSSERIRDTFSSPEDLARRIVQSIRNWEQEHTASQQPAARQRSQAGVILPPQPYFAHPYPLQPNFTGRVTERTMLTEWLTRGNEPVFALTAIGGMGKSALTWAWVQRDVLGLPLLGAPDEPAKTADACRVPEDSRPEGVLWWSFYERDAGFPAFLDHAIAYCSSGSIDPASIQSAYDKLRLLEGQLQQRRFLIVLDGFERVLRAYACLDAAYLGDKLDEGHGDPCCCIDPHEADFLRALASLPLRSRVLLTSRLFPRELENLAGCRHEDLSAMSPEDAVAFFRAQGIKGTRAEIKEACAPYGYHPLALRLLAGVIMKDKRKPGDIQVARRYPVVPNLKGKEQHHILQVAYDTLDKPKRALLSRIAAFRSPMTYGTLLSVFNTWKSEKSFDAALDELIARGLLFYDEQQGRYDLHPVVRQHAYERLADKQGVHTRLRDYFASIPSPDRDQVRSLEDLNPVIELYHHTVRAGQYDEACILFRERLNQLLHYRFGAYQTRIELLRGLFPDGEDQPPRLKEESDRAWTMNVLANSYILSGQSRRALPLYERQNALREKAGDRLSLAIGLGNTAIAQLSLGELRSAEGNLRRRIDLCREIGNELQEAVGHQELGRLSAYRGVFDEATGELDRALASFVDGNQKQSQCVVRAYRALGALLAGEARPALKSAREARELADEVARTLFPVELDFVCAEWLLGWSLAALASDHGSRRDRYLTKAETHLTEALTRCRRINLVEMEPDILLAWARWHRLKSNPEQARKDALEALSIADRCEYRLKQADIHNFLARLDIEAGDRESAIEHAQTGYERAWCDGPPYCYKPALDEAERLLEELGAPKPEMPDA